MVKIELLGTIPYAIDWQKETYDCAECTRCPLYDDNSGFGWCVWLKQRAPSGGKRPDCRVSKVTVEETQNVNRNVRD
jgi:hypothetical protein